MTKQAVEWNEHQEPKDVLTRAIQFPHDERYAMRIIEAYMRLEREKKRQKERS